MSGVKTYKNIAAMQRTGKAAGGRVRKQGGGPGRVGPKRLVAPKWRPDASMISGRHQQDYQAALRGNARARAAQRPGGKTGGRVKKQRGGEPQFRTDPSGRRGQAAYYGHVAPKAAAKQLKKKPPGRAATQGIGMKRGGRATKAKGGKAKR